MKRYILQRKSDGFFYRKDHYWCDKKWTPDKNKATLYQKPGAFRNCVDYYYYSQFKHLRGKMEYWPEFTQRFKSGFEKWYQDNFNIIEVNF